MDSIAQEFARRQHGVVARRQLIDSGVPATTIEKRAGRVLFPIFPAIFSVGRPEVTRNGIWMAGVLAAGSGTALGGRIAAAAWGFMSPKPAVEVIRRGKRRNVRGSATMDGRPISVPLVIRETRTFPAQDVRQIRGIPVSSPARTLLDLASTLTPSALKYAFIEADRLGLLEDHDLIDCMNRGRGRPGAAAFRAHVLDRIPDLDRAKTLLEGLMLDACHRDGVAPPEVNVPIVQKRRARWRESLNP